MGILQAAFPANSRHPTNSITYTPSLDSKTTTMLFKSVLLATFASLALAAPGGGGEYDQGDYNWGKDKCYMKKYTVYETSTAYKDNVYYKTEYKTYPYYETEEKKYPMTEHKAYPTTKSYVKDQKECKTKWKGNHWDYDGDRSGRWVFPETL